MPFLKRWACLDCPALECPLYLWSRTTVYSVVVSQKAQCNHWSWLPICSLTAPFFFVNEGQRYLWCSNKKIMDSVINVLLQEDEHLNIIFDSYPHSSQYHLSLQVANMMQLYFHYLNIGLLSLTSPYSVNVLDKKQWIHHGYWMDHRVVEHNVLSSCFSQCTMQPLVLTAHLLLNAPFSILYK